MPQTEIPVNPDNPNGYSNCVNGQWVSDEDYARWEAMMQAVMEGEDAEMQAYAEQMEAIRPLTAEEVISDLIAYLPGFVQALPDETLGRMQPFFPEWSGEGTDYRVGDLVTYGDAVYRVLQRHASQPTWTPTDAPSLFAKVLTDAMGGGVLPWEQPSAANPYMRGDRVLFDGAVWESLIDNNVWSPSAYPAGWKEVA